MRFRKKMLCSLLALSLGCLPVLSGCAAKGQSASGQKENAAAEEELDADGTDDSGKSAGNLGEFSMEDVNGGTFTQEMFADYDLTLVNVFTTWCSPCVREIPDLEELHKEMEDQGVNVIGIVLDAVDDSGKADSEAVEKAKILAEKTGAAYSFLIPDESWLNGRLLGISAVPETFFVDRAGNIVGETYSGSRSLENWRGIVEQELEEVLR